VVNNPRREISWGSTLSVRALLREKLLRKALYAFFESLGGTGQLWTQVLKKRVSVEFAQIAKAWTEEDWKRFVQEEFATLPPTPKKTPTRGFAGTTAGCSQFTTH